MERKDQTVTEAMVKYSILMPYYNRAKQLESTLQSYHYYYGKRQDWELIVIQDPKERPDVVIKILGRFSDLPTILAAGQGNGNNPAVLYNQGVEWARGQTIILTSPEIYHVSDVLGRLDETQIEGNYIVCSCAAAIDWALEKRNSNAPCLVWTPDKWYQHGERRPAYYHFCSAISRGDWNRIGGFDPEYAKGVGYDDNDFRNLVLRSGLRLVPLDDVLTVHLPHGKPMEDRRKLLRINQTYYEKKWAGFNLEKYGLNTKGIGKYGVRGDLLV
uniref:Putative glycosyltransferase n=1 Tax=viral metagenome TaxID=1070528 RepID=A0A6M3KL32_9ZZZZ